MDKKPADYIQEYYERIHEKYPEITFAQVDEICRVNFKMLKTEMEKGSLKTIRLRYFGTFVVHKGRALGLLHKTDKMHIDGKVSIKIRNYIRGIVKKYLKREHNEEISFD